MKRGREMISFKKHFKIRRVMACLHVDGNTSVEERLMKKKLMKNVQEGEDRAQGRGVVSELQYQGNLLPESDAARGQDTNIVVET